MNARKILIYGVSGSGKTTFAQRLSAQTGIPFVDVDSLTWEPEWRVVPNDEQVRRISAICSKEEWILDSAYGAWMDIPLHSADLIIGLDYSRTTSFIRLLRRTFARVVDRHLICNGNRETLRTTFSKNSVLLWHFRSFRRKRLKMRNWSESTTLAQVILFQRPHEAETWLQEVPLRPQIG